MIKDVVDLALPVDEKLKIQKNRLTPKHMTGEEKRISIVTGTHGDELEGQFVCYELNRIIQENPEHLKGIVDIYPALNPLGIDSISRGIPMFDLDMNRIFPGSDKGAMSEYVAYHIIQDIAGSGLCIDIHASNIFLMEIPQVRISEITAKKLVPYAKKLNVDLVWIHAAATVLESTLAHSLNSMDVPTLVVEMGVGMRITKKYCAQLVTGILNLMKEMDIWDGDIYGEVHDPIISQDKKVGFLNAEASGIFVPAVEHGAVVEEGAHMGDIISPLTGEVLKHVEACIAGKVFTIREYPVVYEGSLLARILGGVKA